MNSAIRAKWGIHRAKNNVVQIFWSDANGESHVLCTLNSDQDPSELYLCAHQIATCHNEMLEAPESSAKAVEVSLTVETDQATQDLRSLEEQAAKTADAMERLNAEVDRLRGTTVHHLQSPEVYLDGDRMSRVLDSMQKAR